jgi:hypothetical protein
MMQSLANRQTDYKNNSVQPSAPARRGTLTRFQARRIKRVVIAKYCRGLLSEAAVARAFSVFPELRSA